MLSQAQGWTDDRSWGRYVPPRRPLPKDVEELAPTLAREQRKLRPGSGRIEAVIPMKTLLRKLGATTYRLWAVLLTLRDDTGETHPSLRGLAEAASMSESQTAKSLARLRKFKLVEDYGFIYRHVPCSCKDGCWGHPVYIRDVYGEVREQRAFYYIAVVPRETVRLAMAAAGQGGARKGAGRPRKVDAPVAEKASVEAGEEVAENKANKSKVGAYKNLKDLSQKNLKVLLQRSPRGGASISEPSEAAKGVQTTQEALARFLSSPPSAFAASPLQTEAQPARPDSAPAMTSAAPAAPGPFAGQAAAVSFQNSNATGKSESMNTPDTTNEVEVLIDGVIHYGLDAIFAAGDAREIGLGGGGRGPRQRYTPEDLRAASQLSNMIEPLRVPAPPKLQAEQDEDSQLDAIKAAYRAVHEKVMRTTYWRPHKAQTLKERGSQLEAAQALIAKDISPLSWARFSFYQWHRMGKKTAPTPAWVWSAKRILEHAGWCHSATGSLITNQAVPVPATHTLMVRLDELRKRLGWGSPTAVVVSEVLPDAELKLLLAKQYAQRIEEQKKIQQRIRNGEWVWG